MLTINHYKIILLFLLFSLGSSNLIAKEIDYFYICNLSNKSKVSSTSSVRVKGTLYWEFHHGSFLQDEDCPTVIVLVMDIDRTLDPSLKKLDKLLYKSMFDTKKISLDVSGDIGWDESENRPNLYMRKVWKYKKLH